MDSKATSAPRSNSQRGATLIEYAIVLAIFVVIFVLAAALLNTAWQNRSDQSTGVVNGIVPCGGGLAANECNY